MESLKRNATNELIYKTEKDSDSENEFKVAKEEGLGNRQGVWDGHVHTAVFKTDNQQGPTVQHRELCSMWQPGWEGSLKEIGYMCIYMAESLCYSSETIITLLTGYPPIQN